jgi:BirA family biotin operon repressor/biotin-[acetyl-CoA-carboxylase] ligase
MHGPPFLDVNALREATFVRHVEIHEALGSTNDRTAELARDATIKLPALIAARHQTAGRGRGDHKWWSAEGALTFSLLIEPMSFGVTASNWPPLSLTAAVAVCDAICTVQKTSQRAGTSPPASQSSASETQSRPAGRREFTLSLGLEDEPARSQVMRAQIKWPNDVILHDRKVAGILIECPGGVAPAKDRVIIGVGINVNNSWHNAPPDVAASGIAICDVAGQSLDRQSILTAFLRAIEGRIKQLSAERAVLQDAWQERSCLTDREVTVETDGRKVEGRCTGIADDGALLVKTKSATERFYSGSVRELR